MKLLLIATGGALGSLARYGIDFWLQTASGGRFPWGTLTVNVLGSFFMAFAVSAAEVRGGLSEELRLTVLVGLLGGFTTYSAFNQHALGYLRERAWGPGTAYVGATFLGCLGAGFLGLALGRTLMGR